MTLSELCIRRPVMTVLLCASAVLAGVLGYGGIPIAALPSFDTPTISVSASLPGASPETMASSVATPLERQFSTIAGVTSIGSTSTLGNTSITLEFAENRDIDGAALDVQAALLRAQRSLPAEMTALPSYRKLNPADSPIVFLSLTSPALPLAELNEYADNLIAPVLSTLPGVAQVNINGRQKFAVRIQLDLEALSARNLTVDEVAAALRGANANTPVGIFENARQTLTLQANRQLGNAAGFGAVIVATPANGKPVRLGDIAQVEDSVESVRTASWANGERAITLSIQRQPGSNTVATVDAIRAALPALIAQMPASVTLNLRNDRSVSIREAIHDVQLTLGATIALVVLTIWLFLHKPSATLIPALSLPISLLGTVALMRAFGYSLDNVSLLAITLAVGLVVDDAIVVLENIVRHVEDGMAPLPAALRGAREMNFTIISISLSLVAVFIPIFFMPGVIGQMFHEFAAVVAIAILVSAFVSLTLIPMLASRFVSHDEAFAKVGAGETAPGFHEALLRAGAGPRQCNAEEGPDQGPRSNNGRHGIAAAFERGFAALTKRYARALDWSLAHRRSVLLLTAATVVATVALFQHLPKGFFPNEDIGLALVTVESTEDISFAAMSELVRQAGERIRAHPAVAGVVANASEGNSGRIFITLKAKRERAHMDTVTEELRRDLRQIAGLAVFVNPVQNLRLGARTSKSRYQYVLRSVRSDELRAGAEALVAKLNSDALFRDVTTDAQLKGLQARLEIDRDKAGALGVGIGDIRSALYSAFGERQVSTIYTASDSYQVILQAEAADRADESAFAKLQVRAKSGALVPLTALGTVKREMGPVAINHTGQLESVTVSFNLAPSGSLGDAARRIERYRAEAKLPGSVLASWGGDAAAFQSSQGSQLLLIAAALLIIYVLLGVLYESYIHPLTILAGLPSAALGALLTLWLFGLEVSIIAMIGVLMLIGIVKKNAIMMIDFALAAQRDEGMRPAQAIRTAALLRFRPIMMTTMAAAMGALPIALGLGAGAELRQPLGLAVVGGLLVSQVITLLITPVIYLALDRWSGGGPLILEGDRR